MTAGWRNVTIGEYPVLSFDDRDQIAVFPAKNAFPLDLTIS